MNCTPGNAASTEELINSRYEDLTPDIKEISKFASAAGIFTLLLKNGKIMHFIPKDGEKFRRWLVFHNIADAKVDR